MLALALALFTPPPAAAAVRPQPGAGDPHIQSVPYDEEQVVRLQIAPGYQLALEFAPDERIENVAVGDAGAWIATPNKRGDELFLKAAAGASASNLTVITDARRYVFDLLPAYAATPDTPYVVRFVYPPPVTATVTDAAPAPRAAADPRRYRLRGARALRPTAIEDDGVRTAIVWPGDRAMPAVFAIGADGKEVLVDGAVRDGRYVIDRVYPHLLFRADRQSAEAVRVVQRARR